MPWVVWHCPRATWSTGMSGVGGPRKGRLLEICFACNVFAPGAGDAPMAANLSDDAKILEEMGYKQELFRGFSGLMSFAFCFTAVSVVPSISLGFFSAVGAGGPAEMVWAWVVGSVFCIIAGISMAEITSVYPSAGSVYHWAGQLGPAEWSPVSSYVCGWFNMFGNIAGDAAFSSGFATCVGYCVVMRDPDTTWTVGQQVGTSVGILFVWLVMDLARIDIQGFVNNFAIVFQMAASVIIVVALLATSSELASAKLVFTAVYDCTSPAIVDGNCTTDSVSGYTVVLGITSVLFAFTGYEAGAHMCEETTNARTSAPWGIVFTVLCCAALGLFLHPGVSVCDGRCPAAGRSTSRHVHGGRRGHRGPWLDGPLDHHVLFRGCLVYHSDLEDCVCTGS